MIGNIEADGGISSKTIRAVADAGIDVSVSGTGVFKAKDVKAEIELLKSY